MLSDVHLSLIASRREDAVALHLLEDVLAEDCDLLGVEAQPAGVRREARVRHLLLEVARELRGERRAGERVAGAGVAGAGHEDEAALLGQQRELRDEVGEVAEVAEQLLHAVFAEAHGPRARGAQSSRAASSAVRPSPRPCARRQRRLAWWIEPCTNTMRSSL